MKRNRKAKILATLGPASSDKKIIEDLFIAGCDVFRLNFSHGDLETHRKNYETIRSLEEKHNHASCILADLQGPKLRVGTFKNTKENLVKGQSFVLDLSSEPGDNNRVNFPHEEIYDFLKDKTIEENTLYALKDFIWYGTCDTIMKTDFYYDIVFYLGMDDVFLPMNYDAILKSDLDTMEFTWLNWKRIIDYTGDIKQQIIDNYIIID